MTVSNLEDFKALEPFFGIIKKGLDGLAAHGRAVATGRPYTNHFVSVITIRDRKVTHWRDYLDPLAVFDALGITRPS
jgi:limonene-1,2-epoxide hydrolase